MEFKIDARVTGVFNGDLKENVPCQITVETDPDCIAGGKGAMHLTHIDCYPEEVED